MIHFNLLSLILQSYNNLIKHFLKIFQLSSRGLYVTKLLLFILSIPSKVTFRAICIGYQIDSFTGYFLSNIFLTKVK